MLLRAVSRAEAGRYVWMYLGRPMASCCLPSSPVVAMLSLLVVLLSVSALAAPEMTTDLDDQRLTIRIMPLATDSGDPYTLYRGIQLRCDIDTQPAVDIYSCGWRFNYGEVFLFNNNKYTLYVHPPRGTVHSVTMVLTINAITKRELGFYTCEGKNSAGLQKRATVQLALANERHVIIKDIASLAVYAPTEPWDPAGGVTQDGFTRGSTGLAGQSPDIQTSNSGDSGQFNVTSRATIVKDHQNGNTLFLCLLTLTFILLAE